MFKQFQKIKIKTLAKEDWEDPGKRTRNRENSEIYYSI